MEKPIELPEYYERCFAPKQACFCLLIPIINEGNRIQNELRRAQAAGIDKLCDTIICDGGSTDGSTEPENLRKLGVNTLLVKTGAGKQGAQMRMGLWWALQRGYEGFVTIDGNDKDSIEDVPRFITALKDGYDFVQGSRFIKGGKAMHTPLLRYFAVRLIHAPIISLTAGERFTDTTNAYRAYSRRYIEHPEVQPFRNIFSGYELLAYLSVRASQLNLRTCEVPVTRAYPKGEKTPTKIKGFKGNHTLMQILIRNFRGLYKPQ